MISEVKTDKKELILDVAESLFAELGFDGASTRQIAKEAGVNIAMLNYYFGGKEGLFIAVFERKVSAYRLSLQNLNNQNISSWTKIEFWIDDYADRMLTTNNFQKIVYRELTLAQRSSVNDTILEMLYKNALELKQIINDGIANGSFKPIDVEMLIASLFGTKIYLVNSSLLASKIFEKDLTNKEVMATDINPRIKEYLKQLLKAYLLK